MIPRALHWPASALVLTLILQFALVAYTFPLGELFSEKELLSFDQGYHLYQILLAIDFAKGFNVVGYDPMFAAGYLGGATFNGSAKLPALMAVLLHSWLSPGQSLKLFVFLAAAVAPACVPLAARWLELDRRETWVAAGFSIVLWWASAFHWYHTHGMVSFVLASFLAIPYFALVVRSLQPGASFLPVLALGIAGAACLLLHPLFPIPVVILTGLYVLIARRELRFATVIPRLLMIALISVGPNLVWIIALFKFSTESGFAFILPEMRAVDARLVVGDLLGIYGSWSMGAKVYPLLVVCALWGVFSKRNEDKQKLSIVFVLAWLILVLYSAFGAAIPLVGFLQPNRTSATAYLLLAIPAALGVNNLIDAIARPTIRTRTRMAQATIVAVGIGAVFVVNELRREVSYAPVGHYGALPPEVRGLGPIGKALLEWIKADTSQEGRVLFETTASAIHDEAIIAGYLARSSDREMIGGPYPRNFFAGFWDGWAFGQPIDEIPVARFDEYLRRYNIGWICAHSTVAKRYLSTVPGVSFVKMLGPVQCYAVDQPLTFVLEGAASVKRRPDGRLLVRFTDPEGGQAILKYHYVTTLRVDSGAEIEPTWIADDPQPFIRIRSKGAAAEIYDWP